MDTQGRNRLTPARKIIIAERQGYKCNTCRKFLPPQWELDHIIPVYTARSGKQSWRTVRSLSNFQVLCSICHAQKTSYENMVRADVVQERNTGRSRFFNPTSIQYISPVGMPVKFTGKRQSWWQDYPCYCVPYFNLYVKSNPVLKQ